MHSILIHKVPNSFKQSQRISDYAIGLFAPVPTKSAVKKAIKRSLILVNDQKVTTGYFVKPGDTISFRAAKKHFVPYPLGLRIYYEDDDLAIVRKPAGLATSNNRHRNLMHALPTNLKPTLSDIALPFPIPVHRLDYATEGLIIIAKNHHSLRILQKMLAEHTITKKYTAIATGDLPNTGKIYLPIDHKKSITFFSKIRNIQHPKAGTLSLLKLDLITGRRHQIRKHLAMLGHPIIGDHTYNDTMTSGFRGLHLVADELQLLHPISQKEMKFSLPLPKKFRKLIKL